MWEVEMLLAFTAKRARKIENNNNNFPCSNRIYITSNKQKGVNKYTWLFFSGL